MRRCLAKLANLFKRSHAERELAREINAHLTILQDEFEVRGMPRQEAKMAARRSYGNVEFAKELHREARSFPWIENTIRDVSYGTRNLLRSPGFTSVAVIALALGIGANTAIFGVVNAVLLRPLEYRDADRLVTILHNGSQPVATANYLDWRDQSRSFEGMGAADFWSPNVTSTDASDSRPAEHLLGLKVTQNMLPLLGVPPLMGSLFTKGEDHEGADHEVILSYALWQRRFHGDPDIIGKQMKLDGEGYLVIGVMPATFKFPPFWAVHAELWAPDALGASIYQRGGNHLRVFARLKPGVTLAQARADIATVTARLEKQYPATNRNVVVRPLKENVVGKIETPLMMMLGAVGFVLLIACANVAHMLLARAADRQKEVAVRVALGAGKARLVAQFLTENLLLAAIGAATGLLLALAGTKALVRLSPAYIPRVQTVATDGRVVLFLIGIALATALCFGLAPALHAAAGNLSDALKEGGRGDSDGVRRHRLRSLLVASEFALAFMLLIGAGLMVRSFYALQSVDTGFNPHNVLSMVVSVAGTKEADAGRREMFYRELLEKIKALPGVASVGGINHLPLEGDLWDTGFEIEGRAKPRPGEVPDAVYRIVLPGYFEAMRLPVKRGRSITYRDNANAQAVAIINECAAERYWPGENPIGKRFVINGQTNGQPHWITIVGVTANATLHDMDGEMSPEMYLAALQTPAFLGEGTDPVIPHISYLTLVVRGDGDPAHLATAVQGVVRSIDKNLPISQVLTMDEAVAHATAQPRFEMLLLGLFGAVALVLAAVGIYGVMNYSVSRRTREIGIRMSLGASRADVLRMIILQGAFQALTGAVVGLVGALLLSKLMGQLLFGVKPKDPLTFLVVTVVLGLTAMVAAGVPARKAMRVEPMAALRSE
jgi:putative ABC transport system permease protein